MSSGNLSTIFFQQLRTLRNKVNSLERDISSLEATVSQKITSQEEKIAELESFVSPYANGGDAICNWLDSQEIEQ